MRLGIQEKIILEYLSENKAVRRENLVVLGIDRRRLRRALLRLMRKRALRKYRQYYIITSNGKKLLEEVKKQATIDQYISHGCGRDDSVVIPPFLF